MSDPRREYEAEVFYEAWRRGLDPDSAVNRAYYDYNNGLSPGESVSRYAVAVERRYRLCDGEESDGE